jgi:dipeptidase E
MKKLVFYSDQVFRGNNKVDAGLINLIDKPNPKIGYIPSCGDKERIYFRENCEYYRKLGFENFFFFDLDVEFENSTTDELLSCDLIHFSGGDPIYFNKNIKEKNFIDVFRNYVEQGGILVGVSGGGLQFTKTVAIYQSFIGDVDRMDQADYFALSALNMVDFEFLPHYNRWDEIFISKVKSYSIKFDSLIYAVRDGDGILIRNDQIVFVGNGVKIENGLITPIL